MRVLKIEVELKKNGEIHISDGIEMRELLEEALELGYYIPRTTKRIRKIKKGKETIYKIEPQKLEKLIRVKKVKAKLTIYKSGKIIIEKENLCK